MIAIKAELEKIIAFVNPKSGGQKGDVIFEKLKRYLKEEQVFDLSEGGPKFGYNRKYFHIKIKMHLFLKT